MRWRRPSWRKHWRRTLLALLGGLLFLRIFVMAPYHIPSASMESTLLVGDYLLVEKLSYGALIGSWRLPSLRGMRRGDIVVFRKEGDGRDYIKRCIGLPGDTVELRGEQLIRNGQPVEEPYLAPSGGERARDFGPIEVPEGELFVMGDHRALSRDSRSYGAIPAASVRGRGVLLYFSWDGEAGTPRWGRFPGLLR